MFGCFVLWLKLCGAMAAIRETTKKYFRTVPFVL